MSNVRTCRQVGRQAGSQPGSQAGARTTIEGGPVDPEEDGTDHGGHVRVPGRGILRRIRSRLWQHLHVDIMLCRCHVRPQPMKLGYSSCAHARMQCALMLIDLQ